MKTVDKVLLLLTVLVLGWYFLKEQKLEHLEIENDDNLEIYDPSYKLI